MKKDTIAIERGQRLRFLREKLGLTRLQFHQITGISASTLRSLEVGETRLAASKALTLSLMFIYVFKMEPEEASQDMLLHGEERKKKPTPPKQLSRTDRPGKVR